MVKADIQEAYRMVPVHPEDQHLLGMHWEGFLYIDKVLPFGLRSAPKNFFSSSWCPPVDPSQQGHSPRPSLLGWFYTGCEGSPSCGFPKEHPSEGVLKSGRATRGIQAGGPCHLLDIFRDRGGHSGTVAAPAQRKAKQVKAAAKASHLPSLSPKRGFGKPDRTVAICNKGSQTRQTILEKALCSTSSRQPTRSSGKAQCSCPSWHSLVVYVCWPVERYLTIMGYWTASTNRQSSFRCFRCLGMWSLLSI